MKKKYIAVAAGCVILLGIAAVFLIGGDKADQLPQAPVTESQEPEVNVGDITGKPANPQPITPPAVSQPEDDPVIIPDGENTDVEIPLTPKVEKPAEAEIDPDPAAHERGEDPAQEKPPATTPPQTTKPPETQPPKTTEPKGGDTNDKGQVWVDGFGWVTPGSGNQGGTTGSDGDINKQVGDM